MKGDSDRTEKLVADVGDLMRAAIDEIVRDRIGALLSSLTGDVTVRPKLRGRAPRPNAPAPSKGASGRRCRICREPGHRANKCPKRNDPEDE